MAANDLFQDRTIKPTVTQPGDSFRSAVDQFHAESSNLENVASPWTGEGDSAVPTAQPLAGSQLPDPQFTPTDTTPLPRPNAPELPTMPGEAGPGFGPIVPDTTQGVTAADSPGALFTEENMGADRTGDFLGGYADRAPDIDPRETVAGQLETILNEDNALFDWARGQAAQYANSRGLINSDIAAEASSQAVMSAALPIAQQDAQVWAQRMNTERQFWYTAGLQAFDATIQSGLMVQDHLQNMVQMSHQGDINSRLQLEQFGYNWQLNEQQNLHIKQQMALQGDINARLALQQYGFDVNLLEMDYGYRTKLMDVELRNALSLSRQDHQQWLERMGEEHANNLVEIEANNQASIDRGDIEFTRNLQQNYLTAVERRTIAFSQEVAQIYQREGLTSAQQAHAVDVARANMENDIKMLARYYASSPGWNADWAVNPSSIPTPGDTGTPPNVPPGEGFPPVTPPNYIPPGAPPSVPPNTAPPDRGPIPNNRWPRPADVTSRFGELPSNSAEAQEWLREVNQWLGYHYGTTWAVIDSGQGAPSTPPPNAPPPTENPFEDLLPIMADDPTTVQRTAPTQTRDIRSGGGLTDTNRAQLV